MPSPRRALLTGLGLIVLRRRLRRSSGPAAAVGLVALDLFGPRIFHLRRTLTWVLALTIVGALVAVIVWWALRRRRRPSATAVSDAPPDVPAPEPQPA
ncbi:MAG TPA: hypothetical protein VH572_07175 [Gaiella sp.]